MSQSSQSQPLFSPEDAVDKSANLTSLPNFIGDPATTQRSTCSQSQSVVFNTTEEGVSGNTPPPLPLPGENAPKRWLTRSNTRAGRGIPTPRQLDTPATPITPFCTVRPTESALASPNPYMPLGEEEVMVLNAEADEAAHTPGHNNP